MRHTMPRASAAGSWAEHMLSSVSVACAGLQCFEACLSAEHGPGAHTACNSGSEGPFWLCMLQYTYSHLVEAMVGPKGYKAIPVPTDDEGMTPETLEQVRLQLGLDANHCSL